tara:strand:+ start:285 stop:527 length:243 start_codon:yes stop_codon:yes gene_type:complete
LDCLRELELELELEEDLLLSSRVSVDLSSLATLSVLAGMLDLAVSGDFRSSSDPVRIPPAGFPGFREEPVLTSNMAKAAI